jgi:hypothetical protein
MTVSARRAVSCTALAFLVAVPGAAQEVAAGSSVDRPRPYPIIETAAFQAAIEAGTRTRTGRPGPNYWTQWAHYDIAAEIDPATATLNGVSTIRYFNRSPNALRRLAVRLRHNLFRDDALKNTQVPITGGVTLSRVAARGEALPAKQDNAPTPGYAVNGTALLIVLASAVAPGDSIDLAFDWSMTLPPDGAPRQGIKDRVTYVAYWYPQMAVYDDVNRAFGPLSGWQTDPYLGNAEFYMGYGDYDVALTVPAGYLVAATGALQNADEVLSATSRERLAEARRSGEVVRVVTAEDFGPGRATAAGVNGKLTWRFRAEGVRDFAFGLSDQFLWDATIALPGDATGNGQPDTTNVFAFYRPDAGAWNRSAEFGRHSVEFLSRFLWPYPYPHMTAVDGPDSCGGMEYPMMTCIGGTRDSTGLYSVTVHEVAHMWFPMMVGSDEKRYTWMDEGLTQFNEFQAEEARWGQSTETQLLGFVTQFFASGGETELMRHGDLYETGIAYGVASYFKMARNLTALRAVLGEELFNEAYREYGRRWLQKHPTPFDLWNTFEDVSGQDLDWFWRTWFYETWTLDQAVGDVVTEGGSSTIVIRDEGLAPMPVLLRIARADGSTESLTLPVEPWLNGAREQRVTVAGDVTEVRIDPDWVFTDVNRGNNTWKRE